MPKIGTFRSVDSCTGVRPVQDSSRPGPVSSGCPGGSGTPEGCSSPWLPADDSVTPWSSSPSPDLFPATWPRPVLSQAPPQNPTAAEPDGSGVGLGRGHPRLAAVDPRGGLAKLAGMRRILLGGVAGVLLLAVGTRAADALGIGGPRLRCGCTETCWCKRPGLTVFRWVTPGRWHHIGLTAEEKRSLAEPHLARTIILSTPGLARKPEKQKVGSSTLPLTTSFGLASSALTSASVDSALSCLQPPSDHDCPCVTVIRRSLSHADRTSRRSAPGSRPLRPELAASLGVWLSSQLAQCAAGRARWRLSGDVAVLRAVPCAASAARVVAVPDQFGHSCKGRLTLPAK